MPTTRRRRRPLAFAAVMLATLAGGRTVGQTSVQPAPGPVELQLPVVFGQVSDATTGAPLADARVTLFAPDLSTFLETRSDARGRYVLARAPYGTWRLGVALRDRAYVQQVVTVGGALTAHDVALGPETHAGRWSVIGATTEFLDATDIAILRPDGSIFYCHDTIDPILFDPVTGAVAHPPSSYSPQGCTSATVMADERIVFVGGQSPADPGSFMSAVPWVKAHHPGGTWSPMADLNLLAGRWYPGLARLSDGSMLVMGGGTAPSAERTDTCELFDLRTEAWSWTGAMLNPTEYPPSALLHTGEVLATWWPPQLWSPVTGTWRAAGPFVQENRGWPGHSDHSIVVLADGRVLALGILEGSSPDPGMGEIYDPASDAWSLTANSLLPRFQAEIVQLPDGRVLAAGGESSLPSPPVPDVLGIVRYTDLYDPAVDAWRRMEDMAWFREYHAVTLLVPDGRVVTTGGTKIKFAFGPTSDDVEAFEPPYLFRGVRPQIVALSSDVPSRGETLAIEVFPATRLTSVVLMGTGAHTHWVDGGVPRRLELPVSQPGSVATVALPADPNVLPLGHYMLFAMVDDIPSIARIVRVVE
jgi:hypothetical protein